MSHRHSNCTIELLACLRIAWGGGYRKSGSASMMRSRVCRCWLVSAGSAWCSGPCLKAHLYAACSTEPKRVQEVPSRHLSYYCKSLNNLSDLHAANRHTYAYTKTGTCTQTSPHSNRAGLFPQVFPATLQIKIAADPHSCTLAQPPLQRRQTLRSWLSNLHFVVIASRWFEVMVLKELGNSTKNTKKSGYYRHFCRNYELRLGFRSKWSKVGLSPCIKQRENAGNPNEQDKCSKVTGPQHMTHLTEP